MGMPLAKKKLAPLWVKDQPGELLNPRNKKATAHAIAANLKRTMDNLLSKLGECMR
jgi:hypothetical protein